MRNPLYKRVPRDLKKNFIRYLGMVLILVCTICIGSSFQSTLNGATAYLENIREDNLQEDGFFEVAEEITPDMKSALKEHGLDVEENFYVTEHEYDESTKILLFNERKNIDIPTVFEGELPEKADEIAIDHVFARNREINIGDSMELCGRKYKVTGTVSLPDYTALFMNNTDLVMNASHFCVSVLSEAGFEELKDKNVTRRYSYRYRDNGLSDDEKVAVSEEIQKYLVTNGASLQNILRREQNQSIYFLEMDIGTDGPFIVVFVYILVAMIAFIFAILTANTIERESVIIGTLRAMGYKKWEIIWHYLQPTMIVAVTGSVIGNILGYTVMIEPFINMYYTSYSIGPIEISFDVKTFIITTVLPVVIMFIINFYMLARKLSLSPLKFLRRELKKGKQKKTIKLPDISFLGRFRMRVILQNKGAYFMLFTGVFFASFLLMFGIGLDPLMKHYTDSIDESLPYSYQYILKAPVDTDEGEKVFTYELESWYKLAKKDIGITCFGIDSDSRYFGEACYESGVGISSSLSQKLGLEVGDELVLKDKNFDREYTFKVAGVYEYDAALAMFIDKKQLNELLDVDEDSYNCILSDRKLDIDEACIAKLITREDMIGAANQMMESFHMVIVFINIFTVAVYIVIMYILTKVVIDKNALSISYMKIFGYNAGEIRKLYLTTTTIVVMASLVVCIPLEIVLFKGTLVLLSSMIEGYVKFFLPVSVYLEIVVVGIVSYFVINAFNIQEVKRIPMTDALKNRE